MPNQPPVLPRLGGAPGEGALVHQPARPRRRRCGSRSSSPNRRRRHQAHEPVRRRDRRDDRGGLRRARARPIRCRPSAASSASTATLDAETAPALTSTFIEAVIAPVDRRRGAGDPRDEGEPARRHRGLRAAAAPLDGDRARDARSILGGVLMQERDRVVEAREPVAATATCPEGRHEARADAPRSGSRCGLPGASART